MTCAGPLIRSVRRIRAVRPPIVGQGAIAFPGFAGPVVYSLSRSPSEIRRGGTGVRGAFQAEPELAGAAFRHGEAVLELEDGSSHRVIMLGHTRGSDTTYFEMRR
jgi:hypothetical protein